MNVSRTTWLIWAFLASLQPVQSFIPRAGYSNTKPFSSSLNAAPKRLEENVDGVVYVNEKCINCAACANFAPSVFSRADQDYAHVVHHQPSTPEEILDARAAMAACPVAAIRSETLAQRRHRATHKEAVEDSWTEQDEALVQQMALSPKVNGLDLPFPRPLMHHEASEYESTIQNVYNIGHHNEKSFGATPYLLQARVDGQPVWFMIDTPKFSKSALEAVTSITGPKGPDYLFLTHVDDTAGHDDWVQQFGHLQRIFHKGDTGRHNWLRDAKLDNEVEILLPTPDGSSPPQSTDDESFPFHAYSVTDGQPLPSDWYSGFVKDDETDVVVLHTPGHSPGSITLWKKPTNGQPGIIFTGDHYAYTTRTGRMSGFPRYGNDLATQKKSLENLLKIDWDVVAPGHGHPRDYSQHDNKEQLRFKEMQEAIEDLHR